MRIALAGNPNCGKTTLFNQLTGANRHVGNFPGVTVDTMTGGIIGRKGVSIVDLPGIYSLTAYTNDEFVSRDLLLKHPPDAIINIIDATSIERGLYLTMQLIELQIPMVLALNMIDEVQANNGSIDVLKLREALGIDVVPISATKKQGLAELTELAVSAAANRARPRRIDFCPSVAPSAEQGGAGAGTGFQSNSVHRAIHAISHIVEGHAVRYGLPARFAATKLLEGDENILKTLALSDNETELVEHAVKEMVDELKTDREAAIVDMRYQFIEEVCRECVVRTLESREYRRSVTLDSLLTHKIFAIPLFLGIMMAVFWLTFGVVGNPLSELLIGWMDALIGAVDGLLTAFGLNPTVQSLIVDGALAGVGAVVGFVPIIITLFLFLSLLEDSGYMARVAFVMDKPLRKIGLSGRSIVPMLMGFGCTVPAIMSTRTLASRRDRKMTALLTPFMSCSAKVPIYALFTAAFFHKHQALVMMSLYVMGIVLGILSGLVMNKTIFRGAPIPFVLELPNYRFPSAKTVLFLMWDRGKDFVMRAFTFIFAATVVIWFLQYFDVRINPVVDSTDSMLAAIGKVIAPIFAPIGLADWRISTALLTGFSAKEAVISTLAVLTGAKLESMGDALHSIFTPLTAMSFLTFTLLYTPCLAAVATVKRELGSIKGLMFSILYQSGIAWVAAFVVYRVGRIWF